MAFEKLVKSTLSKCPFCGGEASWQSDGKGNSFSLLTSHHEYTCGLCRAVIKAKIGFRRYVGRYIANFLVIDTGNVNEHNLWRDKIYDCFVLEQLSLGFYENLTDSNGDIESRLIEIMTEKKMLREHEKMNLYIEKMKDPVFRRKTILKNIFWFIIAIGFIAGSVFITKYLLK